ncbi:ABC transporter substrate-binding protein [Antarcticirhabdus aurantiaca]|uniref:ABC transporter substrate-binding protein n=1 Tax=Antarcticirhabdus aurantiaca TaxID=2606717 RepID=UPI001FEE490D|nr:ABC transporter substrate-binding protein [Antarcticirhabdus aurantiaca]
MTKIGSTIGGLLFSAGMLLTAAAPVAAQTTDTLKLAVGQRGNWDTSVAELGQRAGIFSKHGLNLEILYTQGGGETQQAVLSNSVDVGVAAGVMGALSAFSKGAPIRIIGAETTGGQDLYWYVKSDSPVQSLKDIDGQTIAYSTNGSSTHGVVNAFIDENDLDAQPTATGGPSATLTAVMSGQIDIGWAAPPFGLDLIEKNQIRIIASGSDADAFREQTVRLLITNAATLESKRDALGRFMTAYRETVDWMYADDEALRHYAEFVGISEEIARRTRDEFFPKQALNPDEVVGLSQIVPSAVSLKYTDRELTQEELGQLIQIPPRS